MLNYTNPSLLIKPEDITPGKVTWQSPSNIAIVKYWGKHGQQLPRNPSISLTLSQATTEMTVAYRPKTNANRAIQLAFQFEGNPRPAFAEKIQRFLESVTPLFPFLTQLELDIQSTNTFPHSAGIASSASSMSALALSLCSLEQELFGTLSDNGEFYQKASYLSRLASGSACRSVFGPVAQWGATTNLPGSSDEFAISCADWVHPVFHTFHDDILIVSKQEKSVSSRAGHQLMEGNPYAETRYRQAHEHLRQLITAMRAGDLEVFGRITEQEALTLHALMMSSLPPYLLLEPHTITLIRKIQAFRADTGTPVYFSLDAGPNLHLLYPHEVMGNVQAFIREELAPFCDQGKWIADQAGQGPIKLLPSTSTK